MTLSQPNPARATIATLMADGTERTTGDICRETGLREAEVIHHAGIMRKMGLLSVDRTRAVAIWRKA